MTDDELTDAITDAVIKTTRRIVSTFGPADSLLVAVSVVRVVTELVRCNFGGDNAMVEQLMALTMEYVRELPLPSLHEACDDVDPFTIPGVTDRPRGES